jgi:sortase A
VDRPNWWIRLTGAWSAWRVVVVVVLAASAAILSYPAAADYFSRLEHQGEVFEYIEDTQERSLEDNEAELAAAHRYNEMLPNGPLRDPYVIDTDGRPIELGLGRESYNTTLAFGDGRTMGRLTIPSIKVDLPIFHDTDKASLDAGVGHLYGSGLPVGGTGVHSVLTAHSGVVGSTLFTDLHKVALGEVFQISILTEVYTYQVETIEVVDPDEVTSLRQVPGRDLVTLVTCTPIGVNTQRLRVTGTRVPNPPETSRADHDFTAPLVAAPSLPWWPAPVPLTALAAIAATRLPSRRRSAASPTSAGPWIEITARGRPPELKAWQERRDRVLGGQIDVARPPTAPSVWQRYSSVARAQLYMRTRGVPAVYTWTLRDALATSLAVSAYAFPTEQAARDDARYWIAHADQLRSWIEPGHHHHTTWYAGPRADQPVALQVPVSSGQDTVVRARAALWTLVQLSRTEAVTITTTALPTKTGRCRRGAKAGAAKQGGVKERTAKQRTAKQGVAKQRTIKQSATKQRSATAVAAPAH